ncbi:MAG: hypothetical protein ACRDL3_10260, partial [Solirubrobacterales bacterium]
DRADSGSSALGSPDVQLTAREADCTDWNEASVGQRRVIVDSLAEFEGGPTTGGSGPTLPDDEAYDLFERACAEETSRAFKLYKTYARAAAFQQTAP